MLRALAVVTATLLHFAACSPCNFPRRPALSLNAFVRDWEHKLPVVIRATDDAAVLAATTREALQSAVDDAPSGLFNGFVSTDGTLASCLAALLTDDGAVALDATQPRDMCSMKLDGVPTQVYAPLRELYLLPWDVPVPDVLGRCVRHVIVGGVGSGTLWHEHGQAVAHTLHGRKLWRTKRPSDDDTENFRTLPSFDNATAEIAIAAAGGLQQQWVQGEGAWGASDNNNSIRSGSNHDGGESPPLPEELSCEEFVDVLSPGEALILPGQWRHTTRSLDAWTVTVSYVDYRAEQGLTVPASANDMPHPKYF